MICQSIPDELRQLIYESRFCRPTVRAVAALLPPSDEELDAWLDESIAVSDQILFLNLAVALASLDRPFAARHLVRGLTLMNSDNLVGWFVCRAEGEVAEAVAEAIEQCVLAPSVLAHVLFALALWCREHRDGEWAGALLPEARKLARNKQISVEAKRGIIAVAVITEDRALKSILGGELMVRVRHAMEKVIDALSKSWHGPILDFVPETPARQLASGRTMRRSVPRIGRNEQCPCGSARKYKRCCEKKDLERLHQSTEVAGKTHAELAQDPAVGLTQARLEKLQPHEIGRLDPLQVPEELRGEYFMRLAVFLLFDQLFNAFQKFELTGDERREAWSLAMFFAIRAWRPDVARRFAALDDDGTLFARRPSAELIVQPDAGQFLETLDRLSRKIVDCTDDDELQSFAITLLASPYPALGILLTRSMLPLLPKKSAAFLFDELLAVRDKLNLSPDDAFSDIMDERFTEESVHAGHDAEDLRKAQRKLAEKAGEVRRLKQTIEQTRREITRLEKAAAAQVAPEAPAAPDPQILRDLRDKITDLKGKLKEQYSYRARYRSEVHTEEERYETVQKTSSPTNAQDDDAAEAELLTEESVEGNQPVRLIEFPKKFHQTLDRLPRSVGRAAMTMIGRLAAGETNAFAGVVRLRACHELLRQRIGSDYRLIFRLEPEALHVVELVNRKDLDLALKRLRANGGN